jgi:hypothetical protein
MGVDIWAMSRPELVECFGDEESCTEDHVPISPNCGRLDGLRSGCYVVGKSGRDFGFHVGSAYSFDLWRASLSILALGVGLEEVWNHPRRFRNKPFSEIIDFPGDMGTAIGPKTSMKLYTDFVTYARRARKFYLAAEKPKKTSSHGRMGRRVLSRKYKNMRRLYLKKIAEDFEDAPAIRDFKWMWQVYGDFRKAFRLASDRGFVFFS